MQDKKQRVEPLLRRMAVACMNELVLGHEQARQKRRRDVEAEVAAVGREAQGESVADQYAQRVERVPDSLPARQPARTVEMELIHQHAQSL